MANPNLKQAVRKANLLDRNPVAKAVANTLPPVDRNSPLDNIRQNWSEIEDIYQACANGVYTTSSGIEDAMAAIRPILPLAKADDVKELNVLVAGFNSDIKRLVDELCELHQCHKDKTGEVMDEADLTLSLTLGERYLDFNTRFQAITFPTVVNIMENIGSIVADAKKVSAHVNATNPDVVTDVVAKQDQPAAEQDKQ